MHKEINSDISFYLKKLDNHVQRHLYSIYQREELQDCSLMNMWVSDFLFDNQERDIYQKDIEKEFFINRATASKMLSLMEEKRLIRRTPSLSDARQKKIELLSRGYELQKICVIVRREIEKKIAKGFSKEEIENFKSMCRRMIVNMEQ